MTPGPASDTVTVAALVYTGGRVPSVPCGYDRVCVVDHLIRRAHAGGAKLVVAPEYTLPQKAPEPDPTVGDLPKDPDHAPLQARFSRLAAELQIYLVLDLETAREGHVFNTLLAFDPTGRLVGRHHKFELFEGERGALTAGRDLTVFETPFGRVGLLICADIYGRPEMHGRLVHDLHADIVAFSAAWTAPGAPRWPAAFAHDWGVAVVAANGSTGEGRGGGVYDRRGRSVGGAVLPSAPIILAQLPIAPPQAPTGSH